jgi:hypothetical protein
MIVRVDSGGSANQRSQHHKPSHGGLTLRSLQVGTCLSSKFKTLVCVAVNSDCFVVGERRSVCKALLITHTLTLQGSSFLDRTDVLRGYPTAVAVSPIVLAFAARE